MQLIKAILTVVAFICVLGVVGEMDYADQCRAAPSCHYDGWAK